MLKTPRGLPHPARSLPLSIALATVLAASGLASAQSNITLYGRVDASVIAQRFSATANKPATTTRTVTSDTSLWGIRGSEDLGDGMNAFFKLESGFQSDTGLPTGGSQYFNRETYVGLSHARLGTLQLGSQYTPNVFLTGKVDPFYRNFMGAYTTLFQNAPRGQISQFNNAIQYISPSISGVVLRVMGAPAEGALGSSYAGSAEYTAGKLFVGADFDQTRVAGTSVGLVRPSVTSRTYGVGATYDFSVLKLHGWWQSNRIDGLPNSDGYLLGLTAPMGLGEFRFSWAQRKLMTSTARQAAIGYFYYLSKRSTIYTSLGDLRNEGSTGFSLFPARQDLGGTGLPAPGQSMRGIQFGLRHNF